MAKVRLTNRPPNGIAMRLRFGMNKYVVGHRADVEIPLRYASSLLGDQTYTVEFTSADERDLTSLSRYKRSQIVTAFDLSDGDDIAEKVFGKKKSFFSPKPQPAPEPEPEPVVEEKVEEEKEVLAPLPPDLKKLTNKELKVLLKERGIEVDGKKSILIDALLEAEG